MTRHRAGLRFLLVLVAVCTALPAFAADVPKLAAPPEGERWLSIILDGQKVGFAHQRIAKAEGGYRIDSDSCVKMQGVGFSRDSDSKETYLVGPDLVLRSFTADNREEDKSMVAKGEMSPKGLKVTVESGGGKKERTLKAKGAVYPPQALNIYPLMQGTKAGKTYKISMLDLDSLKVKVKQVKVEVIGLETLPPGTAVLHLRNNLFPIVDNDIWTDLQGNTLKESVRDDFVLTLAEEEQSAKLFLADEALAKRELVLDFSRVRVEPPLDRPGELKSLFVEFTGIPLTQPILQGKGQKGTRLADGRVAFTMPNPAFAAPAGEAPAAANPEPATGNPSISPEILAKKDEIVGAVKDRAQMAKLLEESVAKEIKTGTDSRSALATLKARSGDSRSHAALYAALARAAGIETRLVFGLVYSPGQGFLFHGWAESYLDGWVAVDPTLGQIPADLTHIKLVEGDTPEAMVLLAGMIGKLKLTAIEKRY
jgi:hypothetical protein